MSTRAKQAFNDGRLAFRDGTDIGRNPRKSPAQRQAWRSGFEDEQRRSVVERSTPEQLAKARGFLTQLKEAVAKL